MTKEDLFAACSYDSTISSILDQSAAPQARRRTPEEERIVRRVAHAYLHYRRGSAILLVAGAAERGYVIPIASDRQHERVRSLASAERVYGLRTCRRAVLCWRALLGRLRAIAPIEVWRSVAYALPAVPTGAQA